MGSIPGNGVTRTADVILAVGCRFSDRVTSSYRPGVTFNIPDDQTRSRSTSTDSRSAATIRSRSASSATRRPALQALGVDRARRQEPAYRLPHRRTSRSCRTSSSSGRITSRPMRTDGPPADDEFPRDGRDPQGASARRHPGHRLQQPRRTRRSTSSRSTGRRPTSWPAACRASASACPPRSVRRSALPDTPVLAMVGDGSFLQTGTELPTAVMLVCHWSSLSSTTAVGGDQGPPDQPVRRGARRSSPTGAHRTASPTSPTSPTSPSRSAARAERVEDPRRLGRRDPACLRHRQVPSSSRR